MSTDTLTLLPGTSSTLRVDAHRVLAAREILVGEVLLHFIEHRLIEGLAGGETDIAQRALQVLGLDVLVALDLEAFDRRPFDHSDDQRAAVAPHLDIAEEAGRIQGAHRFGDAALIELIADIDRQVVVDRALGDALQAFDADIADRERRRCGLRRALRADRKSPRRLPRSQASRE